MAAKIDPKFIVPQQQASLPPIVPYTKETRRIYCYTTPDIPKHDGWCKIGQTQQTVKQRLYQQGHTVDVTIVKEWQDLAVYKDDIGGVFTDDDFHAYLRSVGVENKIDPETGRYTEWFKIEPAEAHKLFDAFASRSFAAPPVQSIELRIEQKDAISKAADYFNTHGSGAEFLWNAKPRFGKTVSDLMLLYEIGTPDYVIIVTNRPMAAHSYFDDYKKFIAGRGDYVFVSDNAVFKGVPEVMTYAEYEARFNGQKKAIFFESLQSIKGSIYLSPDGKFNKLKHLSQIHFGIMIIDESDEGVDTRKTKRALARIHHDLTLYQTGTAFKALANEQFSEEQIFNWTYLDEQERKAAWANKVGLDYNTSPYDVLPSLVMYTYRLSNMIASTIKAGADIQEEYSDYAFDLNEFFLVDPNTGEFFHKKDVAKFLDNLANVDKYPFSPAYRDVLNHTLWYLNRVNSARALKDMLEAHPVFSEYEIVLIAGDGRTDDDEEKDRFERDALRRVQKAIATHDKTISITVGQLTRCVTVPEWDGVLMLCNMESAAAYVQAILRVQSPNVVPDGVGGVFIKKFGYVFDFDPARTLDIYAQMANDLVASTAAGKGTEEQRTENIRRMLNFFPVIGEDDEGVMAQLDAAKVLSIPRKIKSEEVVRHGFMSNYLLLDIYNVFSAPLAVQEIIGKLRPAREDKTANREKIEISQDMQLDENGEIEISQSDIETRAEEVFGAAIYEDLSTDLNGALTVFEDKGLSTEAVNEHVERVKQIVKEKLVDPLLATDTALKPRTRKKIERDIMTEIDDRYVTLEEDFDQKVKIIAQGIQDAQANTTTVAELEEATKPLYQEFEEAMAQYAEDLKNETLSISREKPNELAETIERNRKEAEKRDIEEKVRANLRGFCRTVPIMIMAYGDRQMRLSNLDDYTEDEVFEEVTGITEDEFRFLRDGGDYEETNELGMTVYGDDGEPVIKHFPGRLFDEGVFDDSIQKFLDKREELANWFDEAAEEDIFDYIPPQKTSQIFTPRPTVKYMVDALEKEDPGCFDDPAHTFIDPYMKSGLYIVEIAKRLFHSPTMKAAIPDDGERIRHILSNQLYGIAPTRVIYLVAMNYIFGFDKQRLKHMLECGRAGRDDGHENFVMFDSAEAAKNGTLKDEIDKIWGEDEA